MRVRPWLAVACVVAGPGFATAGADVVVWPAKEQTARLLEEHAEFRKLATDAKAFLADSERYPFPKGIFAIGRDVQPGHMEMEQLVSTAIAAHNRSVRDLCAALKLGTETVGLKQPTLKPIAADKLVTTAQTYGVILPKAADFERLLAKAAKALKESRAARASAKSEISAVTSVLGLVADAKYEEAVAEASKLEGLDAILARLAFDHAIRAFDEANPGDHDANERAGLRALNAYRASLDLAPMAIDPKLRAMARAFAEDQSKQGFFGHEHPNDPTRRTAEDRARVVGYEGRVSESVTSYGDGPTAVWGWRGDAGHHSLLVLQKARVAGLGCSGNSVLNVGFVCRAPIAPLLEASAAR